MTHIRRCSRFAASRLALLSIAAILGCHTEPTSAFSTTGPVVAQNNPAIISTNAASTHESEPTVLQNGARIVVAWIGFSHDSTSGPVQYAISDDSGKTWTHPASLALPPNTITLNDPTLAVGPSGEFLLPTIGYGITAGSNFGVYLYTLAPNSKTFGPVVVVDEIAQGSRFHGFDKPVIVRTGAGFLMTYSLNGPRPLPGQPIERVGIAATSVDGIRWHKDTLARNTPALITPCNAGQSVTAVYESAIPIGHWTTTSPDGGLTWSPPVQIDTSVFDSTLETCARHGSEAWLMYGVTATTVRVLHSVDAGAHFTELPIDFGGLAVISASFAASPDGSIEFGYYTSTKDVPFGFVRAVLPPGSTAPSSRQVIANNLHIPPTLRGDQSIIDYITVIPGALVFTDNSSGTSHIAFYRDVRP